MWYVYCLKKFTTTLSTTFSHPHPCICVFDTFFTRAYASHKQKFSMALGAQGAEFMDETGAPQQANSYDCGVYTMVVGEIIACYFNATGNVAQTSEIAAKMNRLAHGGQLSRAEETRKDAFKAGKGAT
jgi:hypothetical protein